MPPRQYLILPQEDVFAAIDRLGAGFGTKARYADMSMGRAQDILRAVVRELIELRMESREYVCTRCKQSFEKPPSIVDSVCPACGLLLKPASIVLRSAYEDRICSLEEKVSRLQDSLSALLDLGLDD